MESSTSTIVSQTVAINAPIDDHFWKLHVPQLFFWTGSEQQLAIFTLRYANLEQITIAVMLMSLFMIMLILMLVIIFGIKTLSLINA
jgi:hypothetical protein